MKSMSYSGIKMAALIAGFSIMAVSCQKKDDPINPVPTGPKTANVYVNFKSVAGDNPIVLNTGTYTNASNENFSISTFNYYISNIKLVGDGIADFAEPESYHLVREGVAGSGDFNLEAVPYGKYKAISFMVGVDSARNVSGAQTGALDQANGMFWTWSTGYIMAKLEGKSDASTLSDKTFKYHIGGFKGTNNVLRTVTLNFPNSITLSSTSSASVSVKADVLKWFAPSMISFAALNTVMSEGATAAKIANNYASMFSVNVVVAVQ